MKCIFTDNFVQLHRVDATVIALIFFQNSFHINMIFKHHHSIMMFSFLKHIRIAYARDMPFLCKQCTVISGLFVPGAPYLITWLVNHVIKVFSKWALLKLNCQNPSYKLGAVLYKWWIQWTCWFQFSFELGSHEHYDYVHTMKCTPWKYHSHRDANNWAFQVCKMCH